MGKGNGYVSSGQMARVLGYTPQTVRGYCEAGAFPGSFQTLGGHWRIPRNFFQQAKQAKDLEKRRHTDQTQ